MFVVNDPDVCRIVFPSVSREGPQVQRSAVIPLPEPVRSRNVQALLVGFRVEYTRTGGDRHYGHMHIDLEASQVGAQSVQVTATLGLRDWTVRLGASDWDDPYEGEVRFAIVAE